MRIIADENVPKRIVKYLRKIGHEVLFIAEEEALRGIKNRELLRLAQERKAVLLTCDSDFLNYVESHPIIYLEQLNDPSMMLELVKSYIDEALRKATEKNSVASITHAGLNES